MKVSKPRSRNNKDVVIDPDQDNKPRGELNHDGDVCIDKDRAHGVPVSIGAKVWFSGQCIEGHVVAWTDELCIIRDEQTGLEHAERWGCVMVQAGGPDENSGHGIDKTNIAKIKADPFYTIAARILALAEQIDKELDAIAHTPHHPLKDLPDEYGPGIYGALRSAVTASMEAVQNGALLYWIRPEVSPNYKGQNGQKVSA